MLYPEPNGAPAQLRRVGTVNCPFLSRRTRSSTIIERPWRRCLGASRGGELVAWALSSVPWSATCVSRLRSPACCPCRRQRPESWSCTSPWRSFDSQTRTQARASGLQRAGSGWMDGMMSRVRPHRRRRSSGSSPSSAGQNTEIGEAAEHPSSSAFRMSMAHLSASSSSLWFAVAWLDTGCLRIF